MDVGIFTVSANHPRFRQTLEMFAKGVFAAGDQVFISDSDRYESCDIAVFFGSWKDRDAPHHNVKRDIVARAPRFIVLETPLIGRSRVEEVMSDDWYRIGLDGFLQDTGQFHDGSDHSADRWKKLSRDLAINVKPPVNNPEGPITIALQLPGDASLRGASIEAWCVESCKTIRSLTQRPILIRLPQLERAWHPVLREAAALPDIELQMGSFDNLIPTLESSYCTVTYTSGLAIDSLLSGCPTIAMDPGNFAFPIASTALSDINHLTCPAREQWLWNLAHCQWHISEIEQGAPWRQLKSLL